MGEAPREEEVNDLAGAVFERWKQKQNQEQSKKQNEAQPTVTHPVSEKEEEPGEITSSNDTDQYVDADGNNIGSVEPDGEIWAFRFRRPSYGIRKVPEFRVMFDAKEGSTAENSEWFSINPDYMKTNKFHICVGFGSMGNMGKLQKLGKYVNIQDIHLMSPLHMDTVPLILFDSYLSETSRREGLELICFTPVEDFENSGSS